MLMFTGLMDGMLFCSIFLLTLQYVVPLQANLQHAHLFRAQRDGMWALWGGRGRETGTGHLPSVAVSCGRVVRLSAGPYAAPWEDSRPGCQERARGGEGERERENK